MNLKSYRGNTPHYMPDLFLCGKGAGIAIAKDGSGGVPIRPSSTQSAADPLFVENRPPGMGLEEGFRDPDPSPKGTGEPPGGYSPKRHKPRGSPRWSRDRHGTLDAPLREKWPGADPPRSPTLPQSAADPPFAENRPPGMGAEESFRDPDPPPKGTGEPFGGYFPERRKPKGSPRWGPDRHGTIVAPLWEKWPGDDPPHQPTLPQSAVDPPFVENRPPGMGAEEIFRDPDPQAKSTRAHPGGYRGPAPPYRMQIQFKTNS